MLPVIEFFFFALLVITILFTGAIIIFAKLGWLPQIDWPEWITKKNKDEKPQD